MATDIAARIAEGLRGERARQKIRSKDLAARSGLSPNTIWRIENAQRSATVEQLVAISDALGVAAATLVPALAEAPTTGRGAA